MNNIELSGKPVEKPENMSLKAKLAWDYFELNHGGWIAVYVGEDAIVVADEGANVSDGFLCDGEAEFVAWLEETAQDHIDNGEGLFAFLMAAKWISPALMISAEDHRAAIESAILAALNDDEKEKGRKMKMKVKDLIKQEVDVDVYDDVCDDIGIAFCGPLTLTQQGKEHFADVLDYDVKLHDCAGATVAKVYVDDGTENGWKNRLRKANEFFWAAAGYCDAEDYDKWFEEG